MHVQRDRARHGGRRGAVGSKPLQPRKGQTVAGAIYEAASPAVLRAMRAVLPSGTLLLPVGGIGVDNMRPWMEAGAAGFGLGSAIYKPGDSAETVGRKARALVAALG